MPRTLDDVLLEVDDGAGLVDVPRDVWAPLPVRTAVHGAARRVRTEAQARRWLKVRCRDDAFRALVSRADAVAIVRARLDLGVAGLPAVNRHRLATLRGAEVCVR